MLGGGGESNTTAGEGGRAEKEQGCPLTPPQRGAQRYGGTPPSLVPAQSGTRSPTPASHRTHGVRAPRAAQPGGHHGPPRPYRNPSLRNCSFRMSLYWSKPPSMRVTVAFSQTHSSWHTRRMKHSSWDTRMMPPCPRATMERD